MKPWRQRVGLCAAIFSIGSCLYAADEETVASNRSLPLWEVGVLGGGAYLPDYPAAGQSRFKWLAAPYAIYRGKILRADREGARARLLKNRFFLVELSVAAAFATSSKDNDARRGMPDLDYIIEGGPRLTIPLLDVGERGRLQLFVPLRAAFSTRFKDFKHRGFTSTPALYFRMQPDPKKEWILVSQLTSNFGDRPFNAYFYDVAPKYATPERQAYDARGGYLGTDLFLGTAIPLRYHWRIFTGLQFLVHSASANTDSPLFKHRFNTSYVVGLSWTFLESHKTAESL